MNFKLILLTAICLATTELTLGQAQPDLFNSALQKTAREDFDGAIDDLEKAADWFSQNSDNSNAYKSSFLAEYLQYEQRRKNQFIEEGNQMFLAPWERLGKCLADCKYSISWANPSPLGSNFGGLLILEKFIRYENKSYPINAVVDVQVLPGLVVGDWVTTQCVENFDNLDNPDYQAYYNLMDKENLIALLQTKGYEDKDFYTKIRKAWRINLKTEKIEEIILDNSSNIACVNNCPGSC